MKDMVGTCAYRTEYQSVSNISTVHCSHVCRHYKKPLTVDKYKGTRYSKHGSQWWSWPTVREDTDEWAGRGGCFEEAVVVSAWSDGVGEQASPIRWSYEQTCFLSSMMLRYTTDEKLWQYLVKVCSLQNPLARHLVTLNKDDVSIAQFLIDEKPLTVDYSLLSCR